MGLTHPGVVSVYDVGEEKGVLYVVMAYVAGSTMMQWLDTRLQGEQTLPVVDGVRLVAAIATALAYAHTQGIHHQDIRPGNILIHPQPTTHLPLQPVLTDLWLSNLVDSEATNQGVSAEVMAYLPPEELLNQAPAGASGEVYSLGVLLYKLSTGQLPSPAGKVMDIIRYHMNSKPTPPAQHRPDLPASVSAIIMKALSKDPAGRYPTPQALAQALKTTAHTLTTTAATPTPAPSAPDGDHLIAHLPNGTILYHPLTQPTVTIGHAAFNNFTLNHPSVDEQHVSLKFEEDSCLVIDLNSINGTFIDAMQLLGGMPEKWQKNTALYVGECRIELQRQHKRQASTTATMFTSAESVAEMLEAESTQVALQIARTNLIAHHAQPEHSEKIHNFTIRASISGARSVAHEAQGTWVQLAPHFELGLMAERAEDAVAGLYHVNLRNDSQVALTLRPSGTDRNGLCEFAFKPALSRIPAGQSSQVALTVQQRQQGLTATAQTHTFTITARPEEEPRVSEKIEGQWVQPIPNFSLNLQVKEGESVAEGTFIAELHNHERVDISFDFSATDKDNQCEFALSPTRGKIKAGQVGQIALRVRRRGQQLVETNRSFPFTFTAQPTSLPRFNKTGTSQWTQLPPIFTYTLQAQQGAGVTKGLFLAEVQNNSPIDLGFELTAQDPQGSLEFSLSTTQGKILVWASLLWLLARKDGGQRTKNGRLVLWFHPSTIFRLPFIPDGRWIGLPGRVPIRAI